MKIITTWYLLLLFPVLAHAQDPKDYYGGWIADLDGVRQTFYLVIRDGAVTGTLCHDCDNLANLAFVDDGTLSSEGLDFRLYYYPPDRALYTEAITATRDNAGLLVTGLGGRTTPVRFHRDMPAPNTPPAPAPETQMNPRPNLSRTDWVLPGPAETISPDKVAGTWLYGSGPGKQWFMFRQHKDGLRGMVCGPCDVVSAMAPLEKIAWSGTTLHFEIVHEDNGFGYLDYGPFSNVADAQIAKHEMHMAVTTSYNPPDTPVIEMTLLGPVREKP